MTWALGCDIKVWGGSNTWTNLAETKDVNVKQISLKIIISCRESMELSVVGYTVYLVNSMYIKELTRRRGSVHAKR